MFNKFNALSLLLPSILNGYIFKAAGQWTNVHVCRWCCYKTVDTEMHAPGKGICTCHIFISGHRDNGYFVTVTEAKEFVTPFQGHNKIVLATSLSLITVKNSAALVTLINGTKFIRYCSAKAFCYCPAIISHRPRSQNILKERALNPEKDSRIKRPRSQVSLEKSSQNYKPLEK
jgi:hypothetical protein